MAGVTRSARCPAGRALRGARSVARIAARAPRVARIRLGCQYEETMTALRTTPLAIGVLAVALALAGCGTQSGRLGTPDPTAATAPVVLQRTSAGEVLATSRGMTLYIYDRDRFNRSQCTGECAQRFVPFLANEGA